jgi:hypothetical protein
MKKDMFGTEIKVGDFVIYAQAYYAKHFEKAIVIASESDFIRVEYVGDSSYSVKQYCKKRGKKSKLTATDKRIIVMGSATIDKDTDVYQNERKRFDKEKKALQAKILKSHGREKKLVEDNKLLQLEVDKIHDRFDILDL